jgi:pimeloyl-ACP methyl ester carboxylesterase
VGKESNKEGRPRVESWLEPVLPQPLPGQTSTRTPGQWRAVVLIHGLQLHPFSKENVARPLLRDWQKPKSKLCRALAKYADIYAFAYAQDVGVDQIVPGSRLLDDVRYLRRLGYHEIVLVGHSAGGVIARQFVEDHPAEGVTKVIQVCTPNGGSTWAKWATARKNQRIFLNSLTKEVRQRVLEARQGKRLPEDVEFVCVVGTGAGEGDGVVRRDCQWTADLIRQGVPAYPLATTHPQAMRGAKGIALIVDLVRYPAPRWTREQARRARKAVLGE